MGMPAAHPSVTTIAELVALPEDGLRHELLDGMHVVTPAPRPLHQIALGLVWAHFLEASRSRNDVQVFTSPADVVLGARTLVQPDLFVVRRTPGKRPEHWAEVGTPLLAVEILSPTTAPRDRGAKRRIYQQAKVQQYWIVDLDARLIERWRPEDTRPEVVDDVLEWTLPGGASGRLDVRRFFLDVWDR